MSVTFAKPPAGNLAVLQQGLQAVYEARGAEGGLAPAAAMRPHPVYELGLQELAEGRGMAAARLVAWRYLLVANNQITEAAELYPDSRGRRSQFGAVTTGFAAGAENALALVDQLPAIQEGDYEIRALRIPALYVMAFWLKDNRDTHDLLIVLPPAFPPMQALHPYTTAEFVSLLRPLAAEKLRQERAVEPGDGEAPAGSPPPGKKKGKGGTTGRK